MTEQLHFTSLHSKKAIKNTNAWRLNNTLLNNQHNTEEIKKEIKICIETNENENMSTQNLWDSVKAVLRERFVAIQVHLKKQEKKQINNLTLHINPTHSSILAWRAPWTEEPGGLLSMGSHRVGHNRSDLAAGAHLKQLEKEERKNNRVSRRKEIIKIRAEINEKETKETIAKINNTKSWFSAKINKIDKTSPKKKGEESNHQN